MSENEGWEEDHEGVGESDALSAGFHEPPQLLLEVRHVLSEDLTVVCLPAREDAIWLDEFEKSAIVETSIFACEPR